MKYPKFSVYTFVVKMALCCSKGKVNFLYISDLTGKKMFHFREVVTPGEV